MPKLFVIGSGFSKAFHDGMPLLIDLSSNLDWTKLPIQKPEYRRLGSDVEELLSYLYQEMPWKSAEVGISIWPCFTQFPSRLRIILDGASVMPSKTLSNLGLCHL